METAPVTEPPVQENTAQDLVEAKKELAPTDGTMNSQDLYEALKEALTPINPALASLLRPLFKEIQESKKELAKTKEEVVAKTALIEKVRPVLASNMPSYVTDATEEYGMSLPTDTLISIAAASTAKKGSRTADQPLKRKELPTPSSSSAKKSVFFSNLKGSSVNFSDSWDFDEP